MRALGLSGSLSILLALAACTHDLDKLQESLGSGGAGTNAAGSGGGAGKSGAGGSDAGSGGSSGGGAGSGGTAGTGSLESCTPCMDPDPIFAGTVKPEACCTGPQSSVCGAKFPSGDKCYARDVPGELDNTCPDATRNGMTFPGCCRPDGQCGVVVESLGLGCIVRQEVPAALGGPLSARACIATCESDADCSSFQDELICAEDLTSKERFCARFCQRDKDCENLSGKVCAIQNNLAENRVDTLCRKPFGTAAPGETCTGAEDCMHGTCLPSGAPPAPSFCTELCGSDTDCSVSGASCINGSIPQPNPPNEPQTIRFCR